MTDIALRQTSKPGEPPSFDIALDGGDVARDDGLRTAVLLSLFLDRRADDDDIVEGDDRRGSWMDQYLSHAGDRLGSRLWLLQREKETDATLARARAYAKEALAWLVDDGIARAVDTEAEWIARGTLGLRVQILFADGNKFEETYSTGG